MSVMEMLEESAVAQDAGRWESCGAREVDQGREESSWMKYCYIASYQHQALQHIRVVEQRKRVAYIVPNHRFLTRHALEEAIHALLQFLSVVRDFARHVQFVERHAELFGQAPETREYNSAGVEVILPVVVLNHEDEVVLDELRSRHQCVFRGGGWIGKLLLCRGIVYHAVVQLEDGGIAPSEICDKFVEHFVAGEASHGVVDVFDAAVEIFGEFGDFCGVVGEEV